MTVAELINELMKHPPDMEVAVPAVMSSEYWELNRVEVLQPPQGDEFRCFCRREQTIPILVFDW